MAAQPPTPERRGLLAKGCSALARAGQMLSTVSEPSKGRQTLQQVAQLMEADPRLSDVLATAEIAQKCRTAADATDDPQVLTVCRQIATSLARTASSLATEIQQPTGTPPRTELRTPPKSQPIPSPEPPQSPAPAPTPPQPRPARPPSPAPSHTPPSPTAPTATTPTPPPAPAIPQPTAPKAATSAVAIDRVTIARTVAEKEAVIRALQDGKRLAPLDNGTLIDTRHNRMWTSRLVAARNHAAARRFAGQCRTGQHADWRLPHPAELRDLLADSGRESLRSLGLFQPQGGGDPAEMLWSSEVKSKFFGLVKQAAACQISTGSTVLLKPSSPNVHVILVRS